MVTVLCITAYIGKNYARDRTCFNNKMCRNNSLHCCVTEILMSCDKSVTQLAEHPLYNKILAFLLVFSILFDEKYFVYRSIIHIDCWPDIPDLPPSWGIWQTYPILKISHCCIECKMFALCIWWPKRVTARYICYLH